MVLLTLVLSALLAGLMMSVGALLAHATNLKSQLLETEIKHGITALGAGALLSAVALVLVPEGAESLSPFWVSLYFVLGAVSFMALDILLVKMNTSGSQLAAMLMDFIPESIALGAAFAADQNIAFLLVGLIALQNLPEGYNAFIELEQSKVYRPIKIILLISLMALLGPIAAVSGYLWLDEYPAVVGAVMLFASGGILYSIFQDIAPQIKLANHWVPPLGAILGFLIGLLGYMLIH